jgi:hypothetical protein
MRRLVQIVSVFILVFLLTCLSLSAQQNPKHLVLKDGSYQSVTKWEIQGNRVRYYSADRYVWEELPNDLVDWPATEKYNAEREALRAEEVKSIAKLNEKEAVENPMVAPGLRLPDGGVFILDHYQSQPQLVELTQNSGELNKQTGHNILRVAINPLAKSSKQTIELPGEHARTQAHVQEPEIWINVETAGVSQPVPWEDDSKPPAKPERRGKKEKESTQAHGKPKASDQDQAAEPPQRYRIARMEQKKEKRIVGQLNVALYGKMSQKQNWVKTTNTPAGSGWIKVTPLEPLTPGEYAVVEVLDQEKNEINVYVWDFGVNPTAPANINAWTARKPEVGPDGKEKPPELEKRPK